MKSSERGIWIVSPRHPGIAALLLCASMVFGSAMADTTAQDETDQAVSTQVAAPGPQSLPAPTENSMAEDTDTDTGTETPIQVVHDLHQKLLEAMQGGKKMGYEGRFSILDPVIASHFDTPLIVKVILSRYWDEISAEQKQNFIKVFHKLSVSTYASRFDEYNGEKFVEIAQEPLKKGRVLVKTELQRTDDKPVKLDYLMQEDNGHWLIISVIADGVNDLSLKRAEYAAVIKDKGYDGLVKDIEQKIKAMESDQKT